MLQSKIFCCEKAPKERRGSMRMPIERDVSYRDVSDKVCGLRACAGSGKTVNISSGGVLFTTQSPLVVGAEVELAISWPALLNNVTPLKLVVSGTLTRSDRTQAAMHIEKYEFKTCRFKNRITKPDHIWSVEEIIGVLEEREPKSTRPARAV